MHFKFKILTFFASASFAVLLTALFVPVLWGMAIFVPFTLSVWQFSPFIALPTAAVFSALVLVPLVRPSAKAWLFPFFLGLVLLAAVLCAAAYSFPLTCDLSNMLFHPEGLIVFAVGGLLCIVEGFHARSQSRLIRVA